MKGAPYASPPRIHSDRADVVIAIIAILASILLPVFAQAREKARAISCISNEKQMGLAFMQYVQDYDEQFPFAEYIVGNSCSDIQPIWMSFIQPYVKNGDNLSYNDDGAPCSGSDCVNATFGFNGVWMCPSFPLPQQGTPYAVSLLICPIGYYKPCNSGYNPPPPATLSRIDSPSDTLLVAEMGVNDGVGTYAYMDPTENLWTDQVFNVAGNPASGLRPNSAQYDLSGYNGGSPAAIAEGGREGDCDANAAEVASNAYSYPGCGMFPRYRHTRTSNVLYSDGHAKAVVRGNLSWFKSIYIQGLYEHDGYGQVL